ncbi:MAG: PIN domain-containing protein [Actinomycetia bacterium]|nr:PIN domain-containing protein [Actinomycetes bacterium]MCH9701742.1 PIN domain-containing protein [Actinomycetes bacterium]MCH9760449.1 PIN domain-containing protein [Actinomycetes bacterium]
MRFLLDGNVLIALVVADHVHHEATERWHAHQAKEFATCPLTQGSLIRLLLREGQSSATAVAALEGITGSEKHEFWPDSVSFSDVKMAGVVGHRQVTDAYLAHLARVHNGRLATFDQSLAQIHKDVADLVPA